MPGERLIIKSVGEGILSDITFAAKDVFDIAGHPTSNGQPIWSDTHPLPTIHATAVENLLTHGATFAGKTVCDEMCYSLAGDNVHYGAPVNPASPERAIGGSSSGSAAAVSGKLVDLALGTDCGGSVRCPASFSGILGIRPSHGRVNANGVAPLADSFDVVGWFARNPELFAKVGNILLDDAKKEITPSRILIAEDGFERLGSKDRLVATAAVNKLTNILSLETTSIRLEKDGLDRWFDAFKHLQSAEIWATHKEWIQEHQPEFGPGVKERFEFASSLTHLDVTQHQPVREIVRQRMDDLLRDGDAIIIMPTAPVSLTRNASTQEINDFRARAMGLTCPAGLSGCPQISLPLAASSGPVGISILGPRGSDEALLDLSRNIMLAWTQNTTD